MRFLRSRTGYTLLTTLVVVASLTLIARAEAANSVPRRMIFNSRLLNANGAAVTSAHKVRFTFWIGANAVPTDLTATGAINLSAPNFVGWKEEQTFTPSSNGNFYVEMGKINPLPSFATLTAATLSNLYMQVEVKPAASGDSAYEILDPKPLDADVDRSPVLSVPFALNADRLDQRDVGTGSGSIPLLLSGGLLPVANIPGGTPRDTFVIDTNNSASATVSLKFGQTLAKTLTYEIANNRFVFNSNVHIQGNLTTTGLINGVDVAALATASTPLKVSSGAGLTAAVTAGNYRINGTITNFTGTSAVALQPSAENYLFFTQTGALQVRSGAFPTTISFIPLAKVTTNTSGVTAVSDQRVLQSDNREHSALEALQPGYPNAAYDADGTGNVGQLSVEHDATAKRNHYQWSSTKTALNDYDVVLRYTLPQKFIRWQATPLTLFYRTSSGDAAISKADIEVYDTAGNAITLGGSSTNLASTGWTSTGLSFSGTPTWTPGQTFLMKIRMFAKDNATVHIGDLEFRTVELDQQ